MITFAITDESEAPRIGNRMLKAGLVWAVASLLAACGGKDSDTGSSSVGGASARSTGGTSPLADPASGGRATGGVSGIGATGGSPMSNATGGATIVSGIGGSFPGGGSGAKATGGAFYASGGATSVPGSGGTATPSASGGTVGSSGIGGSSVISATGGTKSTGGSSAKSSTNAGGTSGGSPSTGGTSSVGGAAGGGSGGTQAVAAFTASYVTPYCTRLSECCTQAGFAAPSAASCANTELGFYQASLASGGAQVNNQGISALLGAIQNTCDQFSYALFGALTSGTRPAGSDCTEVSECQGDSMACIVPSSTNAGKCIALTRGKIGDPCAVDCDNTSSCRWSVLGGSVTESAACWDEDGLHCDSNTNKCVALSGVGKSCESFSDCGVHASCMNSVCVAKGKLGESCSNGRSCESTLICNSSYVCEKMSIAWSGSCG
jgi:hypothetical protein